MAFGFYGVPDVLDFAVGADEEAAAHDSQERFAEEFFHAARAVGFNHVEIWIAEQREIEFLFFLEGGLGFHGIAAGSEDDHVELVELLLCVTKLGRFDGSTGGVGFGKKEEQDALAAKIGEGDVLAVVGLHFEIGSFIAGFQHLQSPRSDTSGCGL